jgi:hypothetical protein
MMPIVKCPDRAMFTKAEITAALFEARGGKSYGYPKKHKNEEKVFKSYDKGETSPLQEYPIMKHGSTWKVKRKANCKYCPCIGLTILLIM